MKGIKVFSDSPLLITKDEMDFYHFDFDYGKTTGWAFQTDDLGVAVILICKSKFSDNEEIKKLEIRPRQLRDSDRKEIVYWLSGGNKAWLNSQEYMYDFPKTYKDLWEDDALRIKKQMQNINTIGELIDLFKYKYIDNAYFFEDAQSNRYLYDEEEEDRKAEAEVEAEHELELIKNDDYIKQYSNDNYEQKEPSQVITELVDYFEKNNIDYDYQQLDFVVNDTYKKIDSYTLNMFGKKKYADGGTTEELKGRLVRLNKMDDEYAVPANTIGVIDFVDGIGQIHIKWENGSSLALVPEIDDYEIFSDWRANSETKIKRIDANTIEQIIVSDYNTTKIIWDITPEKVVEKEMYVKSDTAWHKVSLDKYADGGGVIDFNDLSNIELGDILVQMIDGKYPYLVQVLHKGRKDISVQNLNRVTVLPHNWDGDFIDYFRKLTNEEKSAVFGEPIVLNKKYMIEDLYKTYSKSSKFEEGEAVRVLQTYLEKNNLTPIQRYQVFDEENLVYDTLDDNFVKTSYYKKNYGKSYYQKYAQGGGVGERESVKKVEEKYVIMQGDVRGDLQHKPRYEYIEDNYADGGGVGNEVYIEFLNKEKGFKKDVKHFKSYEEAVRWAKGNFEKFNPDMIKFKMADGGAIDSKKIFTEIDFDRLSNSGQFSSSYNGDGVWVITKVGGGLHLGKFNRDKEYLFILGKKDLSNPLVKWLSENSYSTITNNMQPKIKEILDQKERVIDYYINNSDNEDLISLMGVSDMPNLKQMAEKWVNNRDTYYDKIFNAIDGIHNRAWGENKFVELGLEKFADGGSIPNNYDGKAVRHIWNSWSVSQRKHFLLDHHSSNEVQDSYGEYRTEYVSEVEIENIAEVNYEDLPQDIKTKVFIHTDMGQYADGGGVNFGDGMTSESDGSPYNSIIIKAIQEWNDVADKEDEIGINSKERRIIISHFKNKNNYTIDDVLDWIANDLELDENYADGGGVGKDIYAHQIGKYVSAYYNETISDKDNGYQVNLQFFDNKDDDDYFDEEFITTKSPEKAEALAKKINKEGYEKFSPKKFANGGGVGKVVKTVKGFSIKLNSDKSTKSFIKYVVVDSNGEVMGFNLIQDAVSWIDWRWGKKLDWRYEQEIQLEAEDLIYNACIDTIPNFDIDKIKNLALGEVKTVLPRFTNDKDFIKNKKDFIKSEKIKSAIKNMSREDVMQLFKMAFNFKIKANFKISGKKFADGGGVDSIISEIKMKYPSLKVESYNNGADISVRGKIKNSIYKLQKQYGGDVMEDYETDELVLEFSVNSYAKKYRKFNYFDNESLMRGVIKKKSEGGENNETRFYADGGGVGKMYYHILEYGDYGNIGYQGYYDTIEEAQKQVEKLSDYFPNQTFQIFADKSRKEPPITTMADGGVAYNPVWAEMEAYSPYSSRSEYENKKEYDDLAFASKSFSKSAEILVKENLMNGEICICKLRKILGHEPAYPVQYVGSIKLTKCFLKPFYKI